VRDPRQALGNIAEALLFTYRYGAETRTFLLVTEYPFKSPGSVREFAAWTFEDADFYRLPGSHLSDSFQATGPGAVVIQSIRQKTVPPDRDSVELWFGHNAGGFTITYRQLRGETRGSTATKVGPSTWIYRDSNTGEEFEFDYPFPSLIGPTSYPGQLGS
jgi:hypothetical protein